MSAGSASNGKIQLVLQSASNAASRLEIPGEWKKKDSIQAVMISIKDRLFGVDISNSSVRFLQKVVNSSDWESTTLQQMGIQQGRALLVLQITDSPSVRVETEQQKPITSIHQLEAALDRLLNNNFDVDSKETIVTLLKIIDNVISKPGDPKVRTLKLSNAVMQKKIVSRQGAVDFLVAAGFTKVQTNNPSLLESGEECLVISEDSNDSLLWKARRLLVTKAISELCMKSDELPKEKMPPPRVSKKLPSSPPFDPYKGQRFDAKSAATGQSLGPDGAYVSVTESALEDIKSKQARLESKLQVLDDRELVAFWPNHSDPIVHAEPTNSTTSDGSLLAAQMKRQAQDRKQREEGGFTTKAMRDLQQMKKTKVYASAILRIQFPDGSVLSAKFLPKEGIDIVRNVVLECLSVPNLDFDLYVSPPRRKLDFTKTLQDEGLVPAAKVFVSWKAAPPNNCAVGEFLDPDLFKVASVVFPEGLALVDESRKSPTQKAISGEEDLLRRMMGGSGGISKSGSAKVGDDKNKKPKWFKG